jgi:signal-transduction protein with cAMP-binding, CBS, and nucleotidyltransferase domain
MTKVRDIMTPDPVVLPATTTVKDGARRLRDDDIGNVLIEEDGTLRGIVTDRDLAVRVLAEGLDPESVTLGDACTSDLLTIAPQDDLGDAVREMRRHAVRRVPVTDDGAAIGVLSIGDLAVIEDPESALADISAAAGDH